ncbi:histidine phosphatase family protein [Alteribacter natronophilus]|nr:histidine phosphatase family protein [Alteribacter natronophilus]
MIPAAVHDERRGATRSLLTDLQAGGHILYVRHAEATVGEDQPNLDFDDCATQRNLSDTGRDQARTFGETIRQLGIPVATPVLTSPFCRNTETAALAFGEDAAEVDPFLVDIYNLSFETNPDIQLQTLQEFAQMLEIEPEEGTNQIIIGHSFPPNLGFGEIPDMGAIVIKPLGENNGFDVVATLTLEALEGLE